MDDILVSKYGISAQIVVQGDEAIRDYALKHNINLPPKGQY